MNYFIRTITLLLLPFSMAWGGELTLTPQQATLHGPQGRPNLTADGRLLRYWHSLDSSASWDIQVTQPTKVNVMLEYAHGRAAGSQLILECGTQKLTATTSKTKDWNTFVPLKFGTLNLKPGKHRLHLRAIKSADNAVLDTTGIRLIGNIKSISIPRKPFTRAPGFGKKLTGAHPAMEVTDLTIPGLTIKAGGMGFLSDGTMVVSSWTTDGSIYFIRNYQGDPKKMRISRFAGGLAEPLGIAIVKDRIFVCQKQELTELIDHNGDGKCDEYRCISNGWDVSSNFHEFTFGPVYHNGKLYLNLAVAINPGGATTNPQQKDRGTCIAVNPDTGKYEIISAGLRTPNGITVTSQGHILVNDNQGDWLPASKMVHVRPGAFFHNKYTPLHPWASKPVQLPVVWQPQNEIGNSPTEPIEIPSGPYKGQILHGDIHHGGLKRVFMEEINGQLQGALFRHAQNLRGGINRLAWGPDGNLYIGIAGHRGNWGNHQRHGLMRIAYNKPMPFEMAAVRAKSDGLEIEFTQPLASGQGWDPGYYKIDSWTYKPTKKYGGPKIDQHTLTPEVISVSADRKRVFLKLPDMKPGYLVHILLNQNLRSKDGNSIFAGECWYNLNAIPKDQPGEVRSKPDNAIALGGITEEKVSRVETLHRTFCASCHTTNGKKLVGPSLKGLLGKKQRVHKQGKIIEVTIDEAYIRNSILNPGSEYPVGYQPIMPQTLSDSLSKEDVNKLVDWIKGMK